MGLHSITDDGLMIEHHCVRPECDYHNCANWDQELVCTECDQLEYTLIPAEKMREALAGTLSESALKKVGDQIVTQVSRGNRKQGKTHSYPITHPEIEWTGHDVVGLLQCECGSRMFVKVAFTEKELSAENIRKPQRDPANPNTITGFTYHPMVDRHIKFGQKLKEIGKVYVPEQAPISGGE